MAHRGVFAWIGLLAELMDRRQHGDPVRDRAELERAGPLFQARGDQLRIQRRRQLRHQTGLGPPRDVIDDKLHHGGVRHRQRDRDPKPSLEPGRPVVQGAVVGFGQDMP